MYPISEQIAQDILATIQGVTTGNGYTHDLTAARHVRSGDKRTHLHAIIIQEDPRPASDPVVYNTLEWWLPFAIGVFIIPLEQDTTPLDTYLNTIAADVQKALMVDRYRTGLALDTQIKAAHTVADDGLEFDICVINAEVNYRTNELDPYQQA